MKVKKYLAIAAAALLIVMLFVMALSMSVTMGAKAYVATARQAESLQPEELDADCILVLGCGLGADGKPGQMLRARLDTGIALYERGIAPKLLMSGDHGHVDYDEVNAMKDYAIEQGVPSEDVFMDHAGFSTYESLYRAKAVFAAETVVVVSQAYHLSRAVYDGRMLGLEAWGIAAEDPDVPGGLMRGFREILARNKDFFYCMFKPEPKFLGDVIPVSGDGNVTND